MEDGRGNFPTVNFTWPSPPPRGGRPPRQRPADIVAMQSSHHLLCPPKTSPGSHHLKRSNLEIECHSRSMSRNTLSLGPRGSPPLQPGGSSSFDASPPPVDRIASSLRVPGISPCRLSHEGSYFSLYLQGQARADSLRSGESLLTSGNTADIELRIPATMDGPKRADSAKGQLWLTDHRVSRASAALSPL